VVINTQVVSDSCRWQCRNHSQLECL
jgi:hypothetical protein